MPVRYRGKHGVLSLSGLNSAFVVGFAHMNFRGPEGRGRPDEIPVLDRGNLDANTHYIQGSDARVPDPLRLAFSADVDDTVNTSALRAVLGNPDRDSPWLVDGMTFTRVNGQSDLYNGSGTLISTPAPFDSLQDRVDLTVVWSSTSANMTRIYRECWFPHALQQMSEQGDAVHLIVTGYCYGNISAVYSAISGAASAPASAAETVYQETWES